MFPLFFRKKCIIFYKKIKSLRKTSIIFGVSKSIISIWNKNNLIITKSKITRHRKITKSIKDFIINIIRLKNFITLEKIKIQIKCKYNVSVSIQSINKIIKKNNYVYKRVKTKCIYNTNISQETIKNFKEKVKNKDLIALDETAIYHTMIPYYGRCKKGETLMKPIKLNKRLYTCLMSIDKQRNIKYSIHEKSVNTETLINFINEHKDYYKNKSLLLDNVKFHKSKDFINFCNSINLELVYTLPYSPQLNPIEECFSQMKHYIRMQENVSFNSIEESISKIKKEHIINYYNHALG